MSDSDEDKPGSKEADAWSFGGIADWWAFEDAGCSKALNFSEVPEDKQELVQTIRPNRLGLLLAGVWRDEFQGLFWEYPPTASETHNDGTALVNKSGNLPSPLVAVLTAEDLEFPDDKDSVGTSERVRYRADRTLLWETLNAAGWLPAHARRDAPDFDFLASLDIESYDDAPRIAHIESIMIGLDDFSRWPGPPGIEPPVLRKATEAAKAPVPDVCSPENVVSTISAVGECREWLKGLMKAGPKKKLKSEYRAEALKKYNPRLSGRGFNRAWDEAVEAVPEANWNRSGPIPSESS